MCCLYSGGNIDCFKENYFLKDFDNSVVGRSINLNKNVCTCFQNLFIDVLCFYFIFVGGISRK